MIKLSDNHIKVITKKKAVYSYLLINSSTKYITLVLCVSALGISVYSLCILFLKTLSHLSAASEIYYFISRQDNRSITKQIFYN